MLGREQPFAIGRIPDEAVITLYEAEADEILACIKDLLPLSVEHMDEESLFLQVEMARRRIPERLANFLIRFRRESNECGTILVRNLPTDPLLPPTPSDGKASREKATHISEFNLLLTMIHLGEPIAYADEKDGAIIHNIVPIEGHETRQENNGTVFLEFHTENAFHYYRPDYIGLFCLRSDTEQTTQTLSASVRRALHRVPAVAVALLRRPLYTCRSVSSFVKDGASPLDSAPMPILTGDILDPDLCIDFYHMRACDAAAQWALDTLKEALLATIIGTVLMPGDLLITDNRIAAHARTGFTARFDGADRWLQRLYVVEDYRRSKPSRRRGGHVCAPWSVGAVPDILR